MRVTATVTAALCSAVVLASSPASAGGMVNLHKKAIVGGKLCMADHYHHGQSGAWRTEREARASARDSWDNLVRIEYGRAWSSFQLSHGQEFSCKKVSDGQTSCTVRSKPCRY